VERGMTISDLNRLGEKEDWTDRKADEYQAEMGRVEDGFVIDGRLSFHFIPRSFKVFLDVEPGTGVKRVFGGEARPDERWESAGGLKDGIEKRVKSDMKRYRRLYGLDFRDKSHYDLVIDTTRLTPEEVVEKILGAVKKKRI
jgi:cytidylate kinase